MSLAMMWRCTSLGPSPIAADAHFTVPPLERKVLGDTVAAEDLHAAVDDTPTGLGRDELRHRGFLAIVVAAVRTRRGFERQPARTCVCRARCRRASTESPAAIASGAPNVSRCFEYSTAISCALTATPIHPAA